MTSRSRAKVFGFLAAIIVVGAASVLAQTPEGVSPGAVDRIAEVEGRCPSFYWSSVPGAGEVDLGTLVNDGPVAPPPQGAAEKERVKHDDGKRMKDRQGLVTAIMGEVTDTSGLAFGVVGFSSSPDGGGIAAANLNGGPDLVLDGAADGLSDTSIYQDRIELSSPDPRTFSISNTGGGGMALDVDGVQVVTTDSDLDADKLATGTVPDGRLAGTYSQPLTLSNPANDFTGSGAGLTGVDADTLDGTDGATFATEAEAAALVAAHAASAAHDGRYYTKTQLNTSGAGGAVNWNNLTAVPAGFADGVDDDTTYSPGPGLIVENGEIRIDLGLFHTRTSTLEGVEAVVGWYTSIAIGDDGLGLISYFDAFPNYDLKAAHLGIGVP
jgi:hypothetical protein